MTLRIRILKLKFCERRKFLTCIGVASISWFGEGGADNGKDKIKAKHAKLGVFAPRIFFKHLRKLTLWD